MKIKQSLICIFQILFIWLFISGCVPLPAGKPWELRCDNSYKNSISPWFPIHGVAYGEGGDRDVAFDRASDATRKYLFGGVRECVEEWAKVLLADINSCDNIDLVKRFEVFTLKISEVSSRRVTVRETKFSYQDFTASGGRFIVYVTAEAWVFPDIVAGMLVQEINSDYTLQPMYENSKAFQQLIDLNSGTN